MTQILTNYRPYYYRIDDINDTGWGCGWRCIQMLLSQISQTEFNIFTIAKEVEKLTKDNVRLDLENQKIGMADTYWIMLYVTDYYQRHGKLTTKFTMLTINSIRLLNELYETLQYHFVEQDTLVVVSAGGATGLLAGVRPSRDGTTFEVYLIDPHMSPGQSFNELVGFGDGGRGWIDIKDIILKGMLEIGLDDPDEFLENSSCLFGFIQN